MIKMIKMRPLLVLCMMVSGLIPMAVSMFIVSGQSSKTMESTTYERLEADVAIRRTSVENYFTAVRDQVVTLSDEIGTIQAMRDFSLAFPALSNDFENPSELRKAKADLSRYLDRNFLATLEDTSGERLSADYIVPKSDAGVVAQHYYLAENDNPVGSKHHLLTPDVDNRYNNYHAKYHEGFRYFLELFEYYDVFLVEPERGDIVYSVFKEVDYGTSLFTGPYSDSGLADVVREAMTLRWDEVASTDFGNYTPSYGAAASFFASPIYDGETLLGVLAFQLPVDRLNQIMALSDGLGETGESMLLGGDALMRSQSRFTDKPTILRTTVDTEAVTLAMAGKTGSLVETTDDIDYMYAYAPLDVNGLTWAIVSRMHADEAFAPITSLRNTGIWIAAVAALAVALFSWLLGRYLYRQLGGDPRDMIRIAKAIGAGDLSDAPGDENSRGAYAELVDMRTRLRSILNQANDIASSVRVGARELSEGNVGLSDRTDQQAANLEETGSSTEELTSTVKQNAENAKTANELAMTTRKRAKSSGEVSSNAITAMEEISSASEKIADIIGVIDEIAFQTNLLALNAAVEAARAGEQGRGFAVVASEVRQLAGRSASAAKEIKDLIEDSVHKVKDGTQLVTESGDELKIIVESVSQLTDLVGQIAIATDEQAVGIEQINHALVHMDSVTQQNAAMVQEAASTSRKMSDQANELSSHIGYFTSSHDVDVNTLTKTLDLQPAPGERPPANLPSAAVKESNWQSSKSNIAPPVLDDAANSADAEAPKVQRASGSGEVWDEF